MSNFFIYIRDTVFDAAAVVVAPRFLCFVVVHRQMRFVEAALKKWVVPTQVLRASEFNDSTIG